MQRLIQVTTSLCGTIFHSLLGCSGGALLGAFLATLFAAAPLWATPPEQEPGARVEVRPEDLPEPFATPSVANSAEEIGRPSPPPFRLPPGFKVNLFAAGLDEARWLTVAPSGDVFLAEPKAGRVTLLRDADGDGVAELVTTYAEGFRRPHGLAVIGTFLYVADIERVWRVPYLAGAIRSLSKPEPVTEAGSLGGGGGHWTRTIALAPDAGRFFVAIGSASNIGIEPSPRATVQSFAFDGGDQRTYASGLRNPVGIAVYPGSNDIYVVVNERDGLGDGLVPDYLTRLDPGAFYGWPYAYIGTHPQPGLDGPPELVASSQVPDLLFRAHSAPLGLVFYDATQFPAEYRGDAFVALHGSWNSGAPTGYVVARVPFAEGRPKGGYETFLSGFWLEGEETARVWGRPAGLAVAKDGSLLVADDVGNVVWRVSYLGP
jgi:glucose/arabinose dehydrogenase